jgi:FAD/FMN-containing dehydrogenase
MSYGGNADRLIKAKRHYDPDNIFNSAIPLPAGRRVLAAE